jgi:hypothetical protein
LRHRLLRLEHSAGVGPEPDQAPMTDQERQAMITYWLSQDRGSLSVEDRQRVDGIRYVLDRARRRQDSA